MNVQELVRAKILIFKVKNYMIILINERFNVKKRHIVKQIDDLGRLSDFNSLMSSGNKRSYCT